MNSELKKFLLFTFKALVIIYAFDFSAGFILAKLYARMKSGEKAQAQYFLKKSKADINIFGSSHALYHYNTAILTDSIKLESFNAGRSGQSILYHTALLKAKIKNHIPRIVILDLQEDELIRTGRKYDMLNALMPYYHFDEDIKQAIDSALPRQKYWAWSHIYPYNSSLFSILYRNINNSKGRDKNGYLTLDNKSNKPIESSRKCPKDITVDKHLQNSLEEFITVCTENNIKLYVFISPRYSTNECDQEAYLSLANLLTRQHVKFYDFSYDNDFFKKRSYFYDDDHLNSTGSSLYTSQIAKILKEDSLAR